VGEKADKTVRRLIPTLQSATSTPPDDARAAYHALRVNSTTLFVERLLQQRFGAIGKTGSIATIERFWKTIKDLLGLPLAPPFLRSELERRLDATVTYYAELKPHHGLGGETPADRYFEREPASQNLRSPPRARPGGKSRPVPFRVAYFRRNPRLPYLVPRAA